MIFFILKIYIKIKLDSCIRVSLKNIPNVYLEFQKDPFQNSIVDTINN